MVIIAYKKDALVLKQTLLEEFQSISQKLQLFNVTYDNFFKIKYIYIYHNTIYLSFYLLYNSYSMSDVFSNFYKN